MGILLLSNDDMAEFRRVRGLGVGHNRKSLLKIIMMWQVIEFCMIQYIIETYIYFVIITNKCEIMKIKTIILDTIIIDI